ncbi:hypothetical protein [Muribaculum intestinale]|uniref:hypothetical protein n=1 Tax=Muribaculum intestinale TaxID=1796646 RepID=UPI00272CEBEC|nr:hypothetical protein [Muribaculum intestinale]
MRVAYFGTWGRAGHFVRPIVGQFSKQELEAFERVDLPAFHDAMLADGYAYCLYDDFLGYCIPFSADDKRSGCVTAIFVEGAKCSADILQVLKQDARLSFQFWKRRPKVTDIPKEEVEP